MKSSEIWFSVTIICFLLCITHGNKYQYGNSSLPKNNKKNRESAEPLTASTNQLETSASSPDVVNFLQYLNNSKILNIDSISDTGSEKSNRRSDILTVAIPISELKSLQESGFITQELSLSDLHKLTDSIQQYGITVDGYNSEAAHLVRNPIFANLPEVAYGGQQFIKEDVDQDAYYTRSNDENNFERNHPNFQGYHHSVSQPSVSNDNDNENTENTARDHNNYFLRVAGDSEIYNSYSRGHHQDTIRQSTELPKDKSLERNTQGQNTFNPKNHDAEKFDEYHGFSQEDNQFSNANRPKESYQQNRNSENAPDEHHLNIKDTNFHQEYQQYPTRQKLPIQHQNENSENRETAFRLHKPNYDNKGNFDNYQQFSNKHHQSSVSYVPSDRSDSGHFQKTEADQNGHEFNHATNQLADGTNENTFGGNVIVNRIGDAGVDFPQDTEDVTALGNYKGDDGSGRFGSIPGTFGVDYPNYLSIPKTGFDCRQYNYPGYFADVEAQCQLYHICQTDGRHDSFLCPVGTLFNQKVLVCDWWYNTDCVSSDSYFDRNAYLHQESINANNYKGHHQPNAQHSNTRSTRNFRGMEFSDTYDGARIDQNLNHFNGNLETRSRNLDLANDRNAGNFKKNNWEDIMNDVSRVTNTKYVSEDNAAFPNDKYLSSGDYDSYKVERMDQNINPFNDVSETRVENLDVANERSDNNQKNSWEDITNDFSSEPTIKYVPERHVVFSNDKYLLSGKKIDDKRIKSLSLEEEGIDRPFGKKIDSSVRRDRNGYLEESSIPFDENIFGSEERREYNEDKYGVSDSPIDRLNAVVQKERMHSDNEAINKVLDKSVTIPGNYVKPKVNSLGSVESVKNNEETNSPPAYESQYFGESEEMREEEENNHGEFLHTKFQTDTPIQRKAFKSENNLLKSGRNVEKDKDRHRNSAQLEETGDEESEEEIEEYDERSEMRGALEKDTISVEDGPESTEEENDKEMHSSPILFNPISTRDAPTSGESVLINDRILGETSALPNAEIPSNPKRDSNQIESDKNVKTGEKEGSRYASLMGAVDQRNDAEQRKDVLRNLEAINTSETAKPKSELDENKYSVKESVRKYEDVVGKNERTKDGSTEEELEMKEFSTDDIMSKTVPLGDEIRDMLTDITSGDRLYRDILISEVISPHYRNTIRHGEQSSLPLKNMDGNSDTHKNHTPQNDGKLDSSESSSIMRTENNPPRSYKVNKDFSDVILDTAESRLQENIRKPFEKTFIEEETHGKKYRRIGLRHPGNSTRMSRSRFNDTARKRRLLRKIRHK